MKQTQFKKGSGRRAGRLRTTHRRAAHQFRRATRHQDSARACAAGTAWRGWSGSPSAGRSPRNALIRPINGDQHDTRIENLELITRAEHLRRNYHDRYPLEIAGRSSFAARCNARSTNGRGNVSNTISDLRKHLFDAIQGVRDGSMDTDKAKTVAELAKVVVDSAKVEVDFMKVRGDSGNGTGFIPEEKPQIPDSGATR
jgi:hypothetical protein